MLDELSKVFQIKKLGRARHILGLGIHQVDGGTFLEQRAYAESILEESDFIDAKTRSTPWDSHFQENQELLPYEGIIRFRRVLGQLAYLANGTRPDLSWAVGRLASQMTAPTVGGWDRIKRLLRYLSGTKNKGLNYWRSAGPCKIETYVDSSFAVDIRKGRSVTGFATYVNGGPVLWKSRLQPTVADSPNAAEYIALYESSKATMGLCNLLKESRIELEDTCYVYEDNDGARRLAMNGMGQKKARHLETKHHYVQELCTAKKITVMRISSGEQPADLLTKGSHTGKAHTHLLERLGVMNQA